MKASYLYVQVKVLLASGNTIWKFSVNYNYNYDGYLIRKYSLHSENKDSVIPNNYAVALIAEIDKVYPDYINVSERKRMLYLKELERKNNEERIAREAERQKRLYEENLRKQERKLLLQEKKSKTRGRTYKT